MARYLPDGSTSSFGDGGRVVTGENDFSGVFVFGVSDMARQRDGKLVVVASGNGRGVVIARYTKSGMLDPGFGDGGVVVDPVPDCACVPWGSNVALTPEGRILVSAVDAGVLAYRPDGSRDLSFGNGGRAALQREPRPQFRHGRERRNHGGPRRRQHSLHRPRALLKRDDRGRRHSNFQNPPEAA